MATRAGLLLTAVALLAVAVPAGAKRPGAVSVRDGDLWLGAQRLTEGPAEDSWPDWSPDGRRVVFVRQEPGEATSSLWVVRRDGRRLVRLTRGRVDVMPAWAPDGRRIAYASSPVAGGSFDVRIADARTGAARTVAATAAEEVLPRWQGTRLRWTALEPGEPWPEKASDEGTRAVGPRELLPDFDQRAPFRLVVTGTKLAFASATDNVGSGPLWIRASRPAPRGPMRAVQLVGLTDGSVRAYPDAGRFRYTPSPTHVHWHLLRFQTYELRRASDFAAVVRDRKIGFCLADNYGLAARRVAVFTGARFRGDCRRDEPGALSVEQGTSPGFTDLYPPNFHNQNLELAGLPAGVYVLVHRTNADGALEEEDYSNNAASLRIRLAWEGGSPRVTVLRTCPETERC